MRTSENRITTVREVKLLKQIPKHIYGYDCKTGPYAFGTYKCKIVWVTDMKDYKHQHL